MKTVIVVCLLVIGFLLLVWALCAEVEMQAALAAAVLGSTAIALAVIALIINEMWR